MPRSASQSDRPVHSPRRRTRRVSNRTQPNVLVNWNLHYVGQRTDRSLTRRRGLRQGDLRARRGRDRLGGHHGARRAARAHPRLGFGHGPQARRARPRRPRAVPRRTPHRRGAPPRARGDPPSSPARAVPRRGARGSVGPRARRGRGARARAVERARADDRRQARRADARPARRPDPLGGLPRRRAGHAQPRRSRRRRERAVRAQLRRGPRDAPLPRRPRYPSGRAFRGARAPALRRPAVCPLRARRDPCARREAHARDARGGRPVNAPPPPSSDALALPASGAAGVHPPLGESDLATPLRVTRARGRVRGTLALLGPAFVAAVAYIDPGNFATNITAGARHGYLLVWVIVGANLTAMLVQYLSAKIGIASERNLPELCRDTMPRPVTVGLWLQAEVVAIATDLAEFVGGDRAPPPVRRAAVSGRPDHRGRRLRDPR